MTKRKKARLTNISLAEVSLVQSPAQRPAQSLLAKGDQAGLDKLAAHGLTSVESGHDHAYRVKTAVVGGNVDVQEIVLLPSADEGMMEHRHPVAVARGPDGSYRFQVGTVLGHTHELSDVEDVIAGLTDSEGTEKADDLSGLSTGELLRRVFESRKSMSPAQLAESDEFLARITKNWPAIPPTTREPPMNDAIAKHAATVKKAEDDFEALIDRHQKAHPDLSRAQSTRAIFKSECGKELYRLSTSEPPPSDAERRFDDLVAKHAGYDDFDSQEDRARKRAEGTKKALATEEGKALYNEMHKAEEEVSVEDVGKAEQAQLQDLLKSGEDCADALARIAGEMVISSGGTVTHAQAYKSLLKTPQGALLLKHDRRQHNARIMAASG